jgi:hypothetical protein
MSRITLHQDKRFHLVTGEDHALGSFLQLFDKEWESESPNGEGLILDWSELFGIEINLTGYNGYNGDNAQDIAKKYLGDYDVKLKT